MIFHFYKRLSEYFKIYLLLLGVFMLFRVLFLCTYGNVEILQNFKSDLLKTFWVGFRCDTVVLCYALTPLLILNLLGFLFFFKQFLVTGFNRFLQIFSKCYYIILFTGFFWINICDYFYYRNFQTHFDNRVFGIVEDGTKEVMASVWSDYPVITVILIFSIVLFIWVKIINKLQIREKPLIYFTKIWALIVTLIFSSGILFLGARSSFSTFPFRKNDLAFSVNLRLNDAAANGVFALKNAITDRIQNSLNLNTHTLLSAHGFKTLVDAKRDWDSGMITDSCNFFELKTTSQNAFLENNPPNIVFILMEGWSSDFFNFHTKKFNMMGALEAEFPHLFFYPFGFPINHGTISAMETFLTNNVGPAFSMSEYSNLPLKTSTAFTLHELGYETSYYTGGYTGWRNVGKYFRTQGIENVRGAEYIKMLYPKIEETDWGVFDRYMFDAVFHNLQEKSAQPQFLICMTTTNHSPHKIPKSYSPYPLEFPEDLISRTTGNLQLTLGIMQTFQYANDCLGRFINQLRNSPLGENTIVVITGDHAMTGGFTYKDSELLYRWAVPLAFYIPNNYKKQLNVDTNRLVSHKDILPTIYHLAFSNFSYKATGDNIFDATTADNSFVITQSSWVMGKAGVIHLHSHQSYIWDENYYLQPQNKTGELEEMRKKANAWLFGMKWQTYLKINE
jgi:phosphoglycerol transferase MdoB-like AlkP superfamily enzyme